MSFVANTALPLLHTVGFLTNDSVWGSTYSIWPAQWQMTDGERPELKAPSVLNANFSAVTQAWTNNGIAYASSYLVGHTQKYVMVDIEQSGWDRFLYWDTAEGQLPNGSFVRGPEYNAKDAQRAAAGLTSMADAFAGSSLGAADKYQFGIYNAPGVGGTDVSACLSGAFSREEMYARFLNSSSWFPPALNAALSYLCPEVYPCSSYAMVWKDMVAYNLTRFAYDYAHIVGTAAVRAFPDDVARLRPVVKSTFEVKSFDTTAPVTWPYMGIRTAYTAQLCALRDCAHDGSASAASAASRSRPRTSTRRRLAARSWPSSRNVLRMTSPWRSASLVLARRRWRKSVRGFAHSAELEAEHAASLLQASN
jgi:hypothetical protein